MVIDSVPAFRRATPRMLAAGFERLLTFVEDQPGRQLIAERDGQRVGFLLVIDSMPDEITLLPQAFVAFMAVEPSARRLGIARELLASAEEYARERGSPYMALMVTEENDAARNLYQAAGYFTERRLLCKIL
ncbi:MAG: hypothetical protein DLM50_05585 [Candidatus Meridianibacter frigidus]|nr:MAG: hypothetical protein DLM50_05585 [Candidatus Eremiobacteraeota bacterium]